MQIPMGQGVAVTRLQMAMAMCAIANGGRLMQPMLVKRLVIATAISWHNMSLKRSGRSSIPPRPG